MNYFEKTNKLPSNLFTVRVPIAATYTLEEIDLYGLPMDVANGKTDKESYTNLTIAMFNADRIIDTYISGYHISLVNPKEARVLYDILEQYIELHNVKVTRSLNIADVKDDRLNEIDRMLTDLFDYNKESIVKELVQAPHGFALDIGLAPTGNGIIGNRGVVRIEDNNTNGGGLAARYNTQNNQPMQMDNNFAFNPMDNSINIDMSKVKRRRSYRSKSKSLNAMDMNKVDEY